MYYDMCSSEDKGADIEGMNKVSWISDRKAINL